MQVLRFLVAGGSIVAASVAFANPIPVTPITVGTGGSSALVQIDFGDGATYVFDVAFDGAIDGLDLLDIIDAGLADFDHTLVSFPFGDAVDLISHDDHSNSGFESGSNGFWGYWTRGDGSVAWDESPIGAGDRSITNGVWDAWTWNENFASVTPREITLVPEPATLSLVGGAVVACFVRRRK